MAELGEQACRKGRGPGSNEAVVLRGVGVGWTGRGGDGDGEREAEGAGDGGDGTRQRAGRGDAPLHYMRGLG